MKEAYAELNGLFSRTKADIERFNAMLQPVIDQAKDERERLYFHHIVEEEEQRLERLDILLPMLQKAMVEDITNFQFIQLLEELNLEKFGLHNFREHIDLALFEFQDEPRQSELRPMRERTQADYLKVKDYLQVFNEKFQNQASTTYWKDKGMPASHKRLSVGSLKI